MRFYTICSLTIAITSTLYLVGCDNNKEYITETKYVEPELIPIKSPLIIAHRGASGYLPEHTLAAYELAVEMGAEYIEPDLQLTKDGYLVAVHDVDLKRTTNVLELFGERNGSTKVSEYSLKEIKQLDMKLVGKAQLTYPGFTPSSEDPFRVPTFDEVIELAKRLSAEKGYEIGIYPEAKLQDEDQENKILETLEKFGYTKDNKIFIQSFSAETLRSLKNKMENHGYLLPLVQLGYLVDSSFNESVASSTYGLTCDDYCVFTSDVPPQVIKLTDIKEYSTDIGVSISVPPQLQSSQPTFPLYTPKLYNYAHELGMTVTGWTFNKSRSDAQAITEYLGYFELGMDGFFSNYPDIAVEAKKIFIETQKRIPEKKKQPLNSPNL